MNEPKFQWGPLARGIFMAMLWFTVLIGWVTPTWLLYYLPLLLFLGFGLRPLLEVTGIYGLFSHFLVSIGDVRWKKPTEKRQLEIDRKLRDAKYKHQRRKDPKLPPNW